MTNHHRRWADLIMGALVAMLAILPVTTAIVRWSLDFDASVLNSPFWHLILKSFGYTTLQASLSAALSTGVGLVCGAGLSLWSGRRGLWANRITSALGNFCFVLPGLSVALLLLNLSQSVLQIPLRGIVGIVVAHFILNALFLTAQVSSRIREWFAGAGRELSAAAQNLGAPPARAFLITVAPLLRNEARTWFPLVFLWSFTAFSTVLMLGGHPKFSSPEVLLYYFLQNDYNAARLLVLCLLQFAVACTLLKISSGSMRRKHRSNVELAAQSSGEMPVVQSPKLSRSRTLRVVKHASLIFCALFTLLLLVGLADSLRVLFSGRGPNPELLRAMGHSLLLGTITAVSCWVLSALLFLGSPTMRDRVFLVGALVSPTLLAAAYLSAELDRRLMGHRPLVQIAFCGMAIAFTLLPLMSLWIGRRLENFSNEWEAAAATLGASGWARWRWVYWPLHRDLLRRILRLGFLTGLGEIALCTLIVQDFDFAAGLSRQLASRYDFAASKWLLMFIVLTTLGISLLSKERKPYGNPSI